MTDYHQLTSWTSEELDQEIKSTFQMYETNDEMLKTDADVFDYLLFLDLIVAARDRSWVHCFRPVRNLNGRFSKEHLSHLVLRNFL